MWEKVKELAVKLYYDEGGWINFAVMGGLALANYFANRKKKNQTTTTTPTLDPAYKPLQDALIPNIMNRLNNPAQVPRQYTQQGLATIDRTHRLTQQRSNNDLTARGLASSPIAAAVDRSNNNARTSDMVQFQNSVPLLAREWQNEDLQRALQLMSMGRGQKSEFNDGSSALGNTVGSLAGMLGWMYGNGMLGGGGGPKASPISPYAGNMNFGWY